MSNIERGKPVSPEGERLRNIDDDITRVMRNDFSDDVRLEGRPQSLFHLEKLEFDREAVKRRLPHDGREWWRIGTGNPATIKKELGEDATDIVTPSYSVDPRTNRPVRDDTES